MSAYLKGSFPKLTFERIEILEELIGNSISNKVINYSFHLSLVISTIFVIIKITHFIISILEDDDEYELSSIIHHSIDQDLIERTSDHELIQELLRKEAFENKLGSSDFSVMDPFHSFNEIIEFSQIEIPNEVHCPLCLHDYEPSSKLLLLPCGHYSDFKCFEYFAKFASGLKSIECPLCRFPLEENYLAQKQNGTEPVKMRFCIVNKTLKSNSPPTNY